MNIGIATVMYTPEGKIKEAYFKPTMKVEIPKSFIPSLEEKVEGVFTEADIIKKRSEIILASFFSKMTDIELADREEYEIKSEVIKCSKYENGQVKTCQIKFSFEKV